MRFHELDIWGVYVAPIVPLLVVAWVGVVVLRYAADRAGLLARVWHPALFEFALYVIVLACAVLWEAA